MESLSAFFRAPTWLLALLLVPWAAYAAAEYHWLRHEPRRDPIEPRRALAWGLVAGGIGALLHGGMYVWVIVMGGPIEAHWYAGYWLTFGDAVWVALAGGLVCLLLGTVCGAALAAGLAVLREIRDPAPRAPQRPDLIRLFVAAGVMAMLGHVVGGQSHWHPLPTLTAGATIAALLGAWSVGLPLSHLTRR